MFTLKKTLSGLYLKTNYHKLHSLLTNRGLKPSLHILENELKTFMRKVKEKLQLVPPHIHGRNSAERAIWTFKENFIAGIAITHKDFLLHLWCRFLLHDNLTQNLLWQSRMNPKLYNYAQLYGVFNYNATQLAPPGTKIIINKKLTVRGTWESHGAKVWYIGPSMDHYRYHCVYVTKIRGERESDYVEFYPHNTPLPYKSSS